MTYAGYQPESGISFLETARRRFWWSFSLDHPGFGSRIRAVTAAISALPASALAGCGERRVTRDDYGAQLRGRLAFASFSNCARELSALGWADRAAVIVVAAAEDNAAAPAARKGRRKGNPKKRFLAAIAGPAGSVTTS